MVRVSQLFIRKNLGCIEGARAFFVFTAVAFLLGAAAAFLHLYMRFDHNSQGEMFNAAGRVDLSYAALLFFAVFIPVFGIATLCGVGILLLLRLFRNWCARQTKKPHLKYFRSCFVFLCLEAPSLPPPATRSRRK